MNKNMIDRIDPELTGPLKVVLTQIGDEMSLHDIPAARAAVAQFIADTKERLPIIEGVTTVDQLVPGPTGAPDVAVRIYRTTNRSDTLPALLWIHGGGYVLGNVEGDDLLVKRLTLTVECVTVAVEYHLAPEHPFPAPVEDCYAALKWLASHTGELGVDKTRIAVGGGSAGGGLAAGLALLARDRAEVDVAFQLLIYPMIDDRNIAPASATLPDTLLWTRENNLIGWRSYLGRDPGGEDVSPYAAALRATDLMGVPPAYIAVGDLDLFLQENVAYTQRLILAGVPTELHVYPGAFHGFDVWAPDANVAQRFTADYCQTLRRALHH